jgi:hypothetical protein
MPAGIPGYTRPGHKVPKWILVAVAATFIIVIAALLGLL